MSEELKDIVGQLRTELDELTLVYIDKKYQETTSFMVQSQAISAEIDALSAYVDDQHNKKCEAVLRKKMTLYFSVNETRTLIHDMGINALDGGYETKSAMHLELVGYCKRHGILQDLVYALKERRPRVLWPIC